MAFAAPAWAQDAQAGASQDKPIEDDVHDRRVDYQGNIVVHATGLSQLDVLAGTSVFEAEEIQQNLAPQIGEVLAKLPGVSATGFSPGASRPVLRGFQGERVRVLTDGLGTLDISNTSVDHATTIDPLTAERIEVLRGPAVLLYGSQAIGGAVNVIDKRIPRRVPDEAVHVDGLISGDSASNLINGGGSVDIPLSQRIVAHVDGSARDSGDLSVAGPLVSPSLREELLGRANILEGEGALEEAAALRAAAERRGKLPDSFTQTWTVNSGLAFIDGENTLGAAVGWYDTSYGVPSRPGGAEGDGGVSIDLKQFRADMRGELDLGDGAFTHLKTRVGYSNYTHRELEGDEVGTQFDVEGVEARLELAQKDRGWWRGSLGAQYFYRDFLATGEEANIAPNTSDQFALFALQEFGEGPIQLEAAGRVEWTDVESRPLDVARNFTTKSAALGLIHDSEGGLRAGVNLSRVERAPSAEELFSNGPHVATQAFELGDPDLRVESAWGLEAFLRGHLGFAEINLAVFKNWFSNYIYLAETGEIEDDFPVFSYLQTDAGYFGIEGEISAPIVEADAFTLKGEIKGDYIRATLDDGSPIPRIPPLSLLGGLTMETSPFDLHGEVQWFSKQDRIAAFESTTDGFALVNASLTWRPIADNRAVSLLLAADNIFDAAGRRHASFTKDFVPLAGRNFKASLRFSF